MMEYCWKRRYLSVYYWWRPPNAFLSPEIYTTTMYQPGYALNIPMFTIPFPEIPGMRGLKITHLDVTEAALNMDQLKRTFLSNKTTYDLSKRGKHPICNALEDPLMNLSSLLSYNSCPVPLLPSSRSGVYTSIPEMPPSCCQDCF